MADHIERYLLANGDVVAGRSNAILTNDSTIVRLAAKYSTELPPGFFVGIAERETGFAQNEIDTDYNDDGSERLTSYGVYQLDRAEAARALTLGALAAAISPEDLCDPDVATQVAVANWEGQLERIAAAAGVDPLNPPRDLYAYVAWGHNAGAGEPIKSIQTYGLNWDQLKARPQNQYVTDKLIPYAEAVMARCDQYPLVRGQGAGSTKKSGQLGVLLVTLALLFLLFGAST